jgi:hypothetical protein
MGAILFISFGLMLFLSLPILTCFYAKHLGRNPRKWFLIGILLPGIATIILGFLPDLSNGREDPEPEK